MANEEHLAILRRGTQEWNEWRNRNLDVKPDLIKAQLPGADLRAANLNSATLIGANMAGADLQLANLNVAYLDGADLRGANLKATDLTGARLVETDLDGANLEFTNFCMANLDGANVAGASMVFTSIVDVDLSAVKGLDSVRHLGPSSIGIDTIYKSKGKIPEVFLRGAGVPEEFITYMKSLVANPIEFYSCFISYSTKDQEFAERLHADLQNKNVRCWFAPHDVQGGKKLHEQIDEAIRVHEKVLLILSADSMNSEWVKTEIRKARKREVREKKPVLFPVKLVAFEAIRDWECFDADTGKDSAAEIREYFIPDFSEWKQHDKYKKAFQRLLGDLKAGKRSGL